MSGYLFNIIMMMFKKDYNFKILSILILTVFFLNSIVYGMELPAESNLRPPMMGNSHEGKARVREAKSLVVGGVIDILARNSTSEALREYDFNIAQGAEFYVYINDRCPVVVKEVKLYTIANEAHNNFKQGVLRKFKVLRSIRLFLNRRFPGLRVFLDRTLRAGVENTLKLKGAIDKTDSTTGGRNSYAGLSGYLIAKKKGISAVPFIILDHSLTISAEGSERVIKNPLVQERINEIEIINNVFRMYVAEGRLKDAVVLLSHCMDLFEQLIHNGVFDEDVSVLDNMVLRDGNIMFIDVGTLTEDKDVALDRVQSPNWIESINEAGRRLAIIHPELGKIYLERANRLYSVHTIQAIWGDLYGLAGKILLPGETRRHL